MTKSLIIKFLKFLLNNDKGENMSDEKVEPLHDTMFMLMANGDEVITKMYETDDDNVVCFKNPLIISRYEHETGFNIQLDKWIPYSDNIVFPVNKETIMTHSIINKSLDEYYNNMVNKINNDDQDTIETHNEFHDHLMDKNIMVH